MNKRIVLDIGHGINTIGKGVGTFREHNFNSAVGVAAKGLAEYNGFSVLLPQLPYSKDIPLQQRSAWINAEHRKSPILCLLSIHANAGQGNPSGHDVFYWHTSANGKRLAEIWQRHAKAVLPIPAHGIWESKPGSFSFHIIRETLPPAILAEHFYFTNPVELARCNTSAYVDLCAKVAVQAICEYAGVAYKEPAPSGGEGKVYRVQVGAFADKDNAGRLAADLRAKGYSTLIM